MTDTPDKTVAPEAATEVSETPATSPDTEATESSAKEEAPSQPESEMSDADAAAGRRPPSAPVILPAPDPNTVSGLRTVESALASLVMQVSVNLATGRVAPADRDASIPLLLAVSEFNNVFHRYLAALPVRDAFVHNWGRFLVGVLVPSGERPVPSAPDSVYLITTFNALAAAYTIDPKGVWDASVQFWTNHGYTPASY